MKPRNLTTFLLGVICCGSAVSAVEPPAREQLPPAEDAGPIVVYRQVYRNESLAALGSRLYDKVDYELKLRRLTSDIRVAEAELDVQQERVHVYGKYFGRTSALFLTRQEARLDVLKTQARLKLLRDEKLLALRHRNDQVRYRELLLAEGAARVQSGK